MGLCLDDFGTGWSSLQHLTTFPVQGLKIDRSFVSRIAPHNTEFEIVRSIIALAHTLGLKVTGEGVESSEQWRHLEALGCDNVQGYYVARPMASKELVQYLEDMNRGTCVAAPAEREPVLLERPSDKDGTGERVSGPSDWYRPAPLYNNQP
jgi:EAL domain-containing protein (putative c-di-GMP-specific phosphodiesterase class I)